MTRVGAGFDAHRWSPDRRLVLGGLEIAADGGLAGHSDADVLTHAVIDALLGAAAMGDIGRHFPSSDSAYAGCRSLSLLERVRQMLADGGWSVSNVDATVIAQRPRLESWVPEMRRRLAAALQVSEALVSVKATTTDGMGFTGRGEGIAAIAVAALRAREGELAR